MFDDLDDGARVFVVGPVPRTDQILSLVTSLGVNAGVTDSEGPSPRARVYLDGHYPVVSVDRGRLTWAASWFGDGAYTVADCEHVWQYLTDLLSDAWRGNDIELMLTPATTGRDLWLRTIPKGPGYPVLDRPLQTAIRAGAGQGRIETFGGRGIVTLHEYDARLAYLSLTRRMPIGEPVDLHESDAQAWADAHPFAPARYLVSFYVPAGWGSRRPGILPVARSREVDPLAGWSWPTEPGRVHGPTWCEGSELALARRYGWSVTIHRVIGWEQTRDVFAVWQERLLHVLDVGMSQLDDSRHAAMFRSAIRAIALHTIGALNGSPHKVTHVGPSPHDHGQGVRMLRDGSYTWHTVEPPAWPQLSHPEWTATIWGRARARLLDAPTGATGHRIGALHLPAGSVVAFRTDAIYTSEPTGWGDDDDGKPGRYRYKGAHGPGPWPRSGTDVLRMKGAESGT